MKTDAYRSLLLGLLVLLISSSAHSLIPLEGLLYGDVVDSNKQDPLIGATSTTAVVDKETVSFKSTVEVKLYNAFFKQGMNLYNSCEYFGEHKYSSIWQEAQAKRTIISTLQYIGLDITARSIVEYAKLLELEQNQFDNLVHNLVDNTCSKNLTVYSHKLLKKNFHYLFQNKQLSAIELPSIQNSSSYSPQLKSITNSRQAKKREFDLTIKNFRSLCSWGGDVDDYRLLSPLLKNPFIMASIYNSLLSRGLSYNTDKTTVDLVSKSDTVAVSCNNLICRKSSHDNFNTIFPRLVGSVDLESDLNALYCDHFKDADYKSVGQNKQIKKWIDELTIDSPYLESSNFIALMTNKSDLMIASKTFDELRSVVKSNIEHVWQTWAQEKTSRLELDILYEESLNVSLVSQVNTSDTLKGDFSALFDFSLGEADKVLTDVDKISSTFYISFPNNFLRWMRKEFIIRNNLSDFKGVAKLDKRLEEYVAAQFKKKEKYFLIPIWNERISTILAKEIKEQLLKYKGSRYSGHHNKEVKIPVKFRFGAFALKYLNEKFKSKYRSSNSKI